MLIVDGVSDRFTTVTDREKDWGGTPYAFGTIPNFGGRTTIGARAHIWNEKFFAWRDKAGSALTGTAFMPEGTDRDPAAFELFSELAWTGSKMDRAAWFSGYADFRYGGRDAARAGRLARPARHRVPAQCGGAQRRARLAVLRPARPGREPGRRVRAPRPRLRSRALRRGPERTARRGRRAAELRRVQVRPGGRGAAGARSPLAAAPAAAAGRLRAKGPGRVPGPGDAVAEADAAVRRRDRDASGVPARAVDRRRAAARDERRRARRVRAHGEGAHHGVGRPRHLRSGEPARVRQPRVARPDVRLLRAPLAEVAGRPGGRAGHRVGARGRRLVRVRGAVDPGAQGLSAAAHRGRVQDGRART